MTIQITFLIENVTEASELLSRQHLPAAAAMAPVPSVPAGPQPGMETLEAPNTPIASAAVLQLLAENNLNGSEITGSGKDGRLTKADVVAYLKANTPPAAPEVDPLAIGESPVPAAAPAATKEQVREALVKYQTAVKNGLVADRKSEEEANSEAMETARGLLGKISGGAGTLGALSEDQYGAVVLAATAALNALAK